MKRDDKVYHIFFNRLSNIKIAKFEVNSSSGIQYPEAVGKDSSVVMLKCQGREFLPNAGMKVVKKIDESTGAEKNYLSIFGVPLFEVRAIDENNIMEVLPRGDFSQLPELIVDIESIENEYLDDDLEIDITLKFEEPVPYKFGSGTVHLKYPYKNWKKKLSDFIEDSELFLVDSVNDSQNSGKKISLEGGDEKSLLDIDSKNLISAKTFMIFRIKWKTETKSNGKVLPYLENVRASFRKELTDIGTRSVNVLKKSLISQCFNLWNTADTSLNAPIVSLCQSSGSGKTKIACELLKENPGFYIVFRNSEQTGYPSSNSLSTELLNLINIFCDPVKSQETSSYQTSSIGKILNFFSKLIISYIIKIIDEALKFAENGQDLADAFDNSVKKFAQNFKSNENLGKEFKLIEDKQIDEIYKKYLVEKEKEKEKKEKEEEKEEGKEKEKEKEKEEKEEPKRVVQVADVIQFIKSVLEDPKLCFLNHQNELNDETKLKLCVLLKEKLKKFPFTVVLDEADLLTSIKISQNTNSSQADALNINGFEALRRALSYFYPGTKIAFLTLGTKSTIVDINPPVIDLSSRYTTRKKIPFPITLTSNCNIFSRKYPLMKLKPTHKLLKNPLMFKFLSTMGRGLWGIYPFDGVADQAAKKLKNGSTDSISHYLPVWMTLAGLSANPLSIEAGTLVANHMGTLLDIDNSIRTLTVTYPSEPALALGAHKLLTNPEMYELNTVTSDLFKALRLKTEAVVVDRGEISEAFVAMMVLRVLYKTPNCAKTCDSKESYDVLLNEIKAESRSDYHSLWKTVSHLLEAPEESKSPCYNFPDYKVHIVKDFLNEWIGVGVKDLNKFKFKIDDHEISDEVLDGIINANHFVRLTRSIEDFTIQGENPRPLLKNTLPSADTRLKNPSRNIIDESLLKYGLLRQCGFFLPARHYGIDLIVPVCLKSGGYSFIAIQVKTSGASISADDPKMLAKWNLVTCPICDKLVKTGYCRKCIPEETLKIIYGNQISLLVSLTEDEVAGFKDETDYFKDATDNDKLTLYNALIGSKGSKRSKRSKSKSDLTTLKNAKVMQPFIRTKVPIRPDLMLSKGLWTDDAPNLDFIHRQFCFFSRGWNQFKSIFGKESVKYAKEILAIEGVYRDKGKLIDSRIGRTVIYDLSPCYPEFSDDLNRMRFNGKSELDKIDAEFGLCANEDEKMPAAVNLKRPSAVAGPSSKGKQKKTKKEE